MDTDDVAAPPERDSEFLVELPPRVQSSRFDVHMGLSVASAHDGSLCAMDRLDDLEVLGRGKRLFGTEVAPAAFQFVTSKVSPNGAVIATYARAGEVKTGSFAMEQPTVAEIEHRRKPEVDR